MKITRVYTGPDMASHFEELDIPQSIAPDSGRNATEPLPCSGAMLAEALTIRPAARDFHNAPRRQLVTLLTGAMEIECGDGSRRRFGPGDMLFADDLEGQGHKTRDVEGPVRAVYVFIREDFDEAVWRGGQGAPAV